MKLTDIQKDILDNPQINWCGWAISHNKDIATIENILANPQLPWEFNVLSKYMNYRNILNNPQLPWNYQFISRTRYCYSIRTL